MEANWQEDVEIEVDSGKLQLSAYARDQSGNAPFLHCEVGQGDESAHFSMNISQAERFVEKLSELIKKMSAGG